MPKNRGHRSTFAVLCITELRDQVSVALIRPLANTATLSIVWVRSFIEPDLFDNNVTFDNTTLIYLINLLW